MAVFTLVQWSEVAPGTKGFDSLCRTSNRNYLSGLRLYKRFARYQIHQISTHAHRFEVFDPKLT